MLLLLLNLMVRMLLNMMRLIYEMEMTRMVVVVHGWRLCCYRRLGMLYLHSHVAHVKSHGPTDRPVRVASSRLPEVLLNEMSALGEIQLAISLSILVRKVTITNTISTSSERNDSQNPSSLAAHIIQFSSALVWRKTRGKWTSLTLNSLFSGSFLSTCEHHQSQEAICTRPELESPCIQGRCLSSEDKYCCVEVQDTILLVSAAVRPPTSALVVPLRQASCTLIGWLCGGLSINRLLGRSRG